MMEIVFEIGILEFTIIIKYQFYWSSFNKYNLLVIDCSFLVLQFIKIYIYYIPGDSL